MKDTRIGRTLAGYTIESPLGRGGMGMVYVARHRHLDRRVALKLLPPALADNADFRRRFVRESRLAASLRHPNIVTVYDAGEADGQLFIAMQLVEGTDLATLLRRRRTLKPAAALWVLGQVASALDAAHARGLVHRDVKPANVLVDADCAYLTDFGLTKRTTVSDAGSTAAGQFLGTIDYAAPEQIAGKELDGRTDVYALGCVVYQCLTGSVPYRRDSEIAVLFAHMHDPPPSVVQAQPGLPDAVDAVVARALAKEKEDRQATCGELVVSAQEALGVDPAPGDVPTVAAAETNVPSAPIAAPEPVTVRLQRRSRRPRVVVAAAALALAAAAAAVAVAVSSGGEEGPQPVAEKRADAPKPARGATAVSTRTAKVGKRPFGLAIGEGGVWVANTDDDQVRRLDPRSGRPLGDPIATGDGPVWPTVTAGRVWVANQRSDSVTRIDPATGSVLNLQIPVGDGPISLAAGRRSVWVANEDADTVSSILKSDPTAPGRTIRPCDRPRGIAVYGDQLWIPCRRDAAVVRVDTTTGQPIGRPIPVGRDPHAIAFAGGVAFVTNNDDDSVSRVSVAGGRRLGRPIRVGRAPYGIAFGAGYVWVANSGSDSVTRIHPDTGRRAGRSIKVGDQPVSVRVGYGAVWVSNNDDGTVTRIRP